MEVFHSTDNLDLLTSKAWHILLKYKVLERLGIVEDNIYQIKKEIVEELLAKDKNFFTGLTLEFNVFKYTAIFATYTFIIEVILTFVQNFYSLSNFPYLLLFLTLFGIVGIVGLTELYHSFTGLIRAVSMKKYAYIWYFSCQKCHFFTFSQFKSIIHTLQKSDHSVSSRQIIVKGNEQRSSNHKFWLLKNIMPSSSKIYPKDIEQSYIVTSNSVRRIKDELNSKYHVVMNILFWISPFMIVPILSLSLYYTLHLPLIISVLLLSAISLTLYWKDYIVVKEEVKQEGNHSVFLLFLKIDMIESSVIPTVSFDLFSSGKGYWDHLEKGNLGNPIDTIKGPLYLIDSLLLNKYMEPIGINLQQAKE